MPHVTGENRAQYTFSTLDDYVTPDSVARVIAAFVDSLDMVAMDFKYAVPTDGHRASYNPADMLKLYVYGYMNRVRSSRRLEAETHRNVEVMWLLAGLTPDDKTICNFRKDNAAALKKVFRHFSLWCREQDLYGKKLVGVDGSKFRANTNRRNIHTRKGTEKELELIEKKIEKYMKELEESDATEADEPKVSPERVRDILKHLTEKKDKLQDWFRQIEANGDVEISTIDPDARIMHSNGDARPLDACYNVQTVADSKYNLIVDFEVTTCPNDSGALPEMTEKAKELLGVDEISVVADKGYYDGKDIKTCEENGTTCYVPAVKTAPHAPDPDYDKINFAYNAENDYYTCPTGKVLTVISEKSDGDKVYGNAAACENCSHREKCTTSKRGRTVNRIAEQDTLDTINARMRTDEGREMFRERKKIIEHPFGTVKHVWGFKQFLCRTKERVTGEQSLAFLAYNLRRVYNIFKGNDVNMLEKMA